MRVQVSHRLDSELLEWATRYAAQVSTPEKRITRSAVIEGGVRHLRELAEGGVAEVGSGSLPGSVAAGGAALSAGRAGALRRRQ